MTVPPVMVRIGECGSRTNRVAREGGATHPRERQEDGSPVGALWKQDGGWGDSPANEREAVEGLVTSEPQASPNDVAPERVGSYRREVAPGEQHREFVCDHLPCAWARLGPVLEAS